MKARLSQLLRRYGVPAYFLTWFAYFFSFWSRALEFDDKGNLFANHVNIWGDWAAHFTMGSSLAYRSLWLVDSPLLLGARFSYPYVNDWISALLVQLGMGFLPAFTIPSFLASCLLVVALYFFFKAIFKARTIAILASMIFLLNGGTGFVNFTIDVLSSPQPLVALANPQHEYTRIDGLGIKWISVIDSMVIPQRAFTLGFPLTLIALTIIFKALALPPKKVMARRKRLALAGLILGVMPLVHTHSFLAAGIILSFWMGVDLWTRRKTWRPAVLDWAVLGGISLALAIPIFAFFFANQVHGFIQWYPGWLAREFKINWLVFWFRNWAFTPVLAVIGWLVWLRLNTHWVHKKLYLGLIFAPFFLLFIMANLWLFQPFSWDNTKLIVWASVGFSGLAGYLLFTQTRTKIGRWIVVPLFLVTIASGGIDAYRILRTELHHYQMYSAEELELSEWVKANTPKDAVWMTGNQHNHWLFNLTGRQAVMTYPGWLWTHGYEYEAIEQEMRQLYQNPEFGMIAQKYQIQYVVVGPEEIRNLGASRAEWAAKYPEIKITPFYSIFQIQ